MRVERISTGWNGWNRIVVKFLCDPCQWIENEFFEPDLSECPVLDERDEKIEESRLSVSLHLPAQNFLSSSLCEWKVLWAVSCLSFASTSTCSASAREKELLQRFLSQCCQNHLRIFSQQTLRACSEEVEPIMRKVLYRKIHKKKVPRKTTERRERCHFEDLKTFLFLSFWHYSSSYSDDTLTSMLMMCWFQAMKVFACKKPTRVDPVVLAQAEQAIEAAERSLVDSAASTATIRGPWTMYASTSRLMVQWPLAMEPFLFVVGCF